jgi:hypothetical protein
MTHVAEMGQDETIVAIPNLRVLPFFSFPGRTAVQAGDRGPLVKFERRSLRHGILDFTPSQTRAVMASQA